MTARALIATTMTKTSSSNQSQPSFFALKIIKAHFFLLCMISPIKKIEMQSDISRIFRSYSFFVIASDLAMSFQDSWVCPISNL